MATHSGEKPYCVPTNDYMYEITKDSFADTMHINHT